MLTDFGGQEFAQGTEEMTSFFSMMFEVSAGKTNSQRSLADQTLEPSGGVFIHTSGAWAEELQRLELLT